MKNAIFIMVLACLLAGCAGKGPTAMKLRTEANVTSEQGLPVKIEAQDEKPLPIKMVVPDEVAVGAFVASFIAVIVTSLAAIAAWRAAYNIRKALEEIKKRSDE
jgi:hypothetical protein